MGTDNPTDEIIAQEVQTGNTEAFGILIERYQEKMLRYARRFLFSATDAEDVVQEVFIKSFTNLNSFDTKRKFSSWLYRIAHNEFISVIRKKKLESIPFFDPDTWFPHPVAKEKTDDDILREELKKETSEALRKLPFKYREPVILFYQEDFDYQTIADIMQIPVSTVGVRLKRAREQLKEILDNNNFSYDK